MRAKRIADEGDLVLVDPAVLERQRARSVDPEHGKSRQLDERAQVVVDEAAIAGERRQETAKHVVERNIVVAGNSEHFVTGMLKPLEELAGLAELLGPGALGEVAADDDEVGFSASTRSRRPHQPFVMRAEMQVGKMHEPGHGRASNAACARDRVQYLKTAAA